MEYAHGMGVRVVPIRASFPRCPIRLDDRAFSIVVRSSTEKGQHARICTETQRHPRMWDLSTIPRHGQGSRNRACVLRFVSVTLELSYVLGNCCLCRTSPGARVLRTRSNSAVFQTIVVAGFEPVCVRHINRLESMSHTSQASTRWTCTTPYNDKHVFILSNVCTTLTDRRYEYGPKWKNRTSSGG